MSTRKILTVQLAACALIGLALVGCSGSQSGPDEAAAQEAAAPVEEAVSETMLAAALAGADKVDGAEDHVISRCPGCALAMDGSTDHAVTVRDYEVHFCSDACEHRFGENIEAKLAKLEIPEL